MYCPLESTLPNVLECEPERRAPGDGRMLFTFFGQFLVFITGSIQMATILAGSLNGVWQLMNGAATLEPFTE